MAHADKSKGGIRTFLRFLERKKKAQNKTSSFNFQSKNLWGGIFTIVNSAVLILGAKTESGQSFVNKKETSENSPLGDVSLKQALSSRLDPEE